MIVVSDTSPLNYLTIIGAIDALAGTTFRASPQLVARLLQHDAARHRPA
jgi:hypothetical protein